MADEVNDDAGDWRQAAGGIAILSAGGLASLAAGELWPLFGVALAGIVLGGGAAAMWMWAQALDTGQTLCDEIDDLQADLGEADDELDDYDALRRLVDDALFHGFTAKRKRELERWLNDHPSHRSDVTYFHPDTLEPLDD